MISFRSRKLLKSKLKKHLRVGAPLATTMTDKSVISFVKAVNSGGYPCIPLHIAIATNPKETMRAIARNFSGIYETN